MATHLTKLQDSTTTSYDKTKTTMLGRAYQKTINGTQVIGPPLTKMMDVYTDSLASGAITPLMLCCTPNNRMFFANAIATGGLGTIGYYDFDIATGASAYRGRIQYNLPNTATTAHTIRGFYVDDTNPSNLKIWVVTTGAVLINGGLFYVGGGNLSTSDFTTTGGFITLPMATSNAQKAVYKLEPPTGQGANFVMTTGAGLVVPTRSTDNNLKTKVYVHNGTAATHQYYCFEGATAPALSTQNCTGTTTNASPTFTLSSHGYLANDPVIITANAPGGFTAATVASQTVYFVRATNLTQNTFELSATSGGVAINCTTSVTPTIQRAFGMANNMFSFKTGNLTALSGALLIANNECYTKPSHTVNSGSDCIFLATGTNLYLGKFSDLADAVTNWSSLVTSNVLGSGLDVVAPTAVYTTYSDTCDTAVFTTQTVAFIAKKLINNSIVDFFGQLSNVYLESTSPITLNLDFVAVSGIDSRDGWLFACGSNIGQRVIIAYDMRSNYIADYSKVISPVIFVGNNVILDYITTIEELFDDTGSMVFYVRSGLSANDVIFDSVDGGWVQITTATDLHQAFGPYAQCKIMFQSYTTPAQLHDVIIRTDSLEEISEYWTGSVENTSLANASPCYTAFRLVKAYTSTVPTLYFRAYDDAGNLVASADTTTNPTKFKYSTDNGTSWSALGTIPNTVGTTEVRYEWLSPVGVRVVASLKEA